MSTPGKFSHYRRFVVILCLLLVHGRVVTAPLAAEDERPATIAAQDTTSGNTTAIENKISTLIEGGQDDEALLLGDELLKLAQASGDNEKIANALSIRGGILLDRNALVKAREHFAKASELLEKLPLQTRDIQQYISRNLVNLALVDQLEGDPDSAERRLNRAIGIQEQILPRQNIDTAAALVGLAKVSQLRGDFASEEKLWRRALDMRRTLYVAQHYNIAVTLEGLAGALESQEKIKDAEALLREALVYRTATQVSTHPHLASVHQRLGNNLRRQRRYREAEQMLKTALKMRERSSAQPGDKARNLVDLGLVYLASHKFADAEIQFDKAVGILNAKLPPYHPWTADALMNLAFARSLQGKDSDAVKASRAASQIFIARPARNAALQNVQFQDHVRYLWALHARSPSGKAKELAAEAFEIAQRANITKAAESATRMSARLAAETPELQRQLRQQQDLTRSLADADAMLMTLMADDAPTEALTRARVSMNGLSQQLSDLDTRIAQSFPSYQSYVKPRPLSAIEAQHLLAADQVLIFVQTTITDVFVWCLTSESLHWSRAEITPEALDDAVASLHKGLVSGPMDEGVNAASLSFYDLGLAYDLYRRLFGPLDDIIKSKPNLLYVPAGRLAALPLSVLVRSRPTIPLPTIEQAQAYQEADWILRKNSIAVLPDVPALRGGAGLERIARTRKSLIAFADPEYGRSVTKQSAAPNRGASRGARRSLPAGLISASGLEALKKFEPLPGTRDEVLAVAGALGAAKEDIYLGRAASETTVKELDAKRRLSDFSVVYFAMHGITADSAIEKLKIGNREPALVMSLPASATVADDGLLSLTEILQLHLDADWVVLSACDTAAGESAGGEALSGLARAFFYAGARSLLVTQWGASDTDTQYIMRRTFEIIAKEPGVDRSKALARAMLSRIDSAAASGSPWDAYPSYWGPYELITASP